MVLMPDVNEIIQQFSEHWHEVVLHCSQPSHSDLGIVTRRDMSEQNGHHIFTCFYMKPPWNGCLIIVHYTSCLQQSSVKQRD